MVLGTQSHCHQCEDLRHEKHKQILWKTPAMATKLLLWMLPLDTKLSSQQLVKKCRWGVLGGEPIRGQNPSFSGSPGRVSMGGSPWWVSTASRKKRKLRLHLLLQALQATIVFQIQIVWSLRHKEPSAPSHARISLRGLGHISPLHPNLGAPLNYLHGTYQL